MLLSSGERLQDSSPLVWKQALDGLIALGGLDSISTIEAAYSRAFDRMADQSQFREFLDEARKQLHFGFFRDVDSTGTGV